jgi:hypothetical protein
MVGGRLGCETIAATERPRTVRKNVASNSVQPREGLIALWDVIEASPCNDEYL